ncbi:MAG TPA: hypothetical protein VFC78_15455 [Tepidisphaeraceae bacterium]|nr:hypothetical protein [Tepidisphaeraceae bacterium]
MVMAGFHSSAFLAAATAPLRAASNGVIAELPASPPLADVPAHDESGLMLTISEVGKDAAHAPAPPDVHSVRMLAMYVANGAAPSPFTAPGPFRATFEGDINMRLRDFLAFFAQGRGKLTITINSKAALKTAGDDLSAQTGKPIRLNKGKNHLLATYESPAAGDAALRVVLGEPQCLARAPPADGAHARRRQHRASEKPARARRTLFDRAVPLHPVPRGKRDCRGG